MGMDGGPDRTRGAMVQACWPGTGSGAARHRKVQNKVQNNAQLLVCLWSPWALHTWKFGVARVEWVGPGKRRRAQQLVRLRRLSSDDRREIPARMGVCLKTA